MISLDPALNYCGVAIWDDRDLVYAATIKGHDTLDCVDGWDYIATRVYEHLANHPLCAETEKHELVYEMPQLLAQWRKGDPNAILQVAGGLGSISNALAPLRKGSTTPVRPSEWTNGKKKGPNHRKLWRRLRDFEQVALTTSFSKHKGEPVFEDALAYLIQYGDVADFEHALDAVCVGLYHLGRFDKY